MTNDLRFIYHFLQMSGIIWGRYIYYYKWGNYYATSN